MALVSRPVLITARIELEPMTARHLPALVDLDADPQVLRYILGRARTEREVHDFWRPICDDTDADGVGLGWWVGLRRDTREFLGWWDLSPSRPVPTSPSRAEMGWRLSRSHWGHGYATEGAARLLAYGFDEVGLETVWAETMAVNERSRRVMTKLGMRHVRTEVRDWEHPLPGAEHGEVVYEIARAPWEAERRSAASTSAVLREPAPDR